MVTVNPLSGLYSGASSQLQKTAVKVQNTISTLVGGSASKARGDVSGVSIAAQLQNQVSSLKAASSNVAQSSSLAQVAEGGISRQLEIVGRLRQLATQANNGALDSSQLKGLDIEFQSLVNELGRIGNTTQFNGQKLLDGSLDLTINDALGTEGADAGANLAPGDLSPQTLFEGQSLNVLSQSSAANAAAVLEQAQQTLQSAQSQTASFLESLDFAAANLETAIFNQEAARSAIDDADFAEAATQLSLLNLQNNAQIAVQAQSNKLPPSVLDLLNDNN